MLPTGCSVGSQVHTEIPIVLWYVCMYTRGVVLPSGCNVGHVVDPDISNICVVCAYIRKEMLSTRCSVGGLVQTEISNVLLYVCIQGMSCYPHDVM